MNTGIIILICKILILGLQPWIQQEWELFHLNNGIIIQTYKIKMVILLLCLYLNIVSKYQMIVGIMIQTYKMMTETLLRCYWLKIILFLLNNGGINQNYKIKTNGQQPCIQHIIANRIQTLVGIMIHYYKLKMVLVLLYV